MHFQLVSLGTLMVFYVLNLLLILRSSKVLYEKLKLRLFLVTLGLERLTTPFKDFDEMDFSYYLNQIQASGLTDIKGKTAYFWMIFTDGSNGAFYYAFLTDTQLDSLLKDLMPGLILLMSLSPPTNIGGVGIKKRMEETLELLKEGFTISSPSEILANQKLRKGPTHP